MARDATGAAITADEVASWCHGAASRLPLPSSADLAGIAAKLELMRAGKRAVVPPSPLYAITRDFMRDAQRHGAAIASERDTAGRVGTVIPRDRRRFAADLRRAEAAMKRLARHTTPPARGRAEAEWHSDAFRIATWIAPAWQRAGGAPRVSEIARFAASALARTRGGWTHPAAARDAARWLGKQPTIVWLLGNLHNN